MICQLPLPSGTKPEKITLQIDGKPVIVKTILQDSQGYYFFQLPNGIARNNIYLSVQYAPHLSQLKPIPAESSLDYYKDYTLNLPPQIVTLIDNPLLSKVEKVNKLFSLFEDMIYENTPELAKLYEGLSGEARVNKCLELGRGCCSELAQTFATIVGRYLKCNVRLINGLSLGGQTAGLHAWVEVQCDNQWISYDPSIIARGSSQAESDDMHHEQPPINDDTSDDEFDEFVLNHQSEFSSLKRHSTKNPASIKKYQKHISDWCFKTGHLRPSVSIKQLPTTSQGGQLNLSILQHSQQLIYNRPQLHKGNPFPFVEVVLYKNEYSPENKDYLTALLNMKMPIYLAYSNPPRLEKCTAIHDICWTELASKESMNGQKNCTTYVAFSELVTQLMPRPIDFFSNT